LKEVEAIVPKVGEMDSQLVTISDDMFKSKGETEDTLKCIQSDIQSAKQAISDSKRYQEKLLAASEKKIKAPVLDLKSRVDRVECDIKDSSEKAGILKRKVEQVAMHVDDSPDALAKDRLLKVVKLCLNFEDEAAHNPGQKSFSFRRHPPD